MTCFRVMPGPFRGAGSVASHLAPEVAIPSQTSIARRHKMSTARSTANPLGSAAAYLALAAASVRETRPTLGYVDSRSHVYPEPAEGLRLLSRA